jgi:hypothetical protein
MPTQIADVCPYSWCGPRFVALATSLILAAGCAAGSPSPSGPSSALEHPEVRLTTTHFRILADRAESAALTAMAERLEAEYGRVTADLRTGDVPTVTVWVWVDTESFLQDMMGVIGRRYDRTLGYVRGANAISVRVNAELPKHAAHEFSHVVSMSVNATIPNNPRWLWETVALYENGEFIDPNGVADLRAGRFPTLSELNVDFNDGTLVYSVGYVLGEFIVSTWDMGALIRLIQTNGNVGQVLGLTEAQFEQRWYAFLRTKYLQ